MNRRKIVVIEDEPDIVEVISYNLKREGYNVLAVDRGDESINLIRNQSPSLIILDLMLPGMDGLSVCRQLKSDPMVNDIPVIIISAKGEESDIVVGLEMGADDYLTKPFSPRELLARVELVTSRLKFVPEGRILSAKRLHVLLDTGAALFAFSQELLHPLLLLSKGRQLVTTLRVRGLRRLQLLLKLYPHV